MTASPDSPHIGLVVEGPGDKYAVPALLRAWLSKDGDYRDLLGKPISCNGREKAIMPKGLEGFVAAAAARPGCSGVLVVLDSEGDLVCDLGPSLWARAKRVTPLPVSICLAERNFEDWIFASAETLDLGLAYEPGKSGIGAIKAALQPSKYVKPTWQPRLTARMDLSLAADRSPSIRRLFLQFERLIGFVKPDA